MYTLYYSPGACSLAVHALLHQLAVPFKIIRVDIGKAENRHPDYLKLNPRGQVPVLMDSDKLLKESAAIAVYLLEQHPDALLPSEPWERFKALESLSFYNSSLQQAYGAYFLLQKNLKDETVRQEACVLAAKRISFLWREVETQLTQQKYLNGEVMTIGDFFHAVIANWSAAIPHPITLGPGILRVCREVSTLPCFAQALAAEEIHYNLLRE